jgi:hypothetical protein
MEVSPRPYISRFPTEICLSTGGVVLLDLVILLLNSSRRGIDKAFHRKSRRHCVHTSYSYLQVPQEVQAIPIL